MSILAVLLDVIIVAVVVIFAVLGRKRGFLKTIFSLAGVVTALLLSLWLSRALSGVIYDTFINDRIQSGISTSITDATADTYNEIHKILPEYLISAAEGLGVDLEQTINSANTNDESIGFADNIAKSISQDVAKPFITAIISLILFVVLFFVLKIVLGLLIKALNIFARLPVLNSANKFLGLVLGLIEGLVVAVMASVILTQIIGMSDNGILGITIETIDSTYVFKVFDNAFSFLK